MPKQQPSLVFHKTPASPPPSSNNATSLATSPSSFDNNSTVFDYTTLNSHQNQDPVIQKIKNVSPLLSQYTLDDHNVLYKIVTRKNGHILQLPYLPASLTSQVLFMYHNSTFNGSHFGIKRTYYKLRDRSF